MSDPQGGPEVIHRRDNPVDEDMPKFVREWWGWTSPIGLGLFLIMLGVVAMLVRFTLVGLK